MRCAMDEHFTVDMITHLLIPFPPPCRATTVINIEKPYMLCNEAMDVCRRTCSRLCGRHREERAPTRLRWENVGGACVIVACRRGERKRGIGGGGVSEKVLWGWE
jgi:hypothetical protein